MNTSRPLNLQLPGNPRYQPKCLVPIFGYDNLYQAYVQVELVVIGALAQMGVISEADYALLTPEIRDQLKQITTSEVDEIERSITKHDIRALVQAIQQRMPIQLRRWVHVPLTSYDVIDTGRALQFMRAYREVLAPKLAMLLGAFANRAEEHAETVMIGRTHGQHALPITAGFWFATVLSRLIENALSLQEATGKLVGKIAGPVGAYNAQVGLNLYQIGRNRGRLTLEEYVMMQLGLKPAQVSTQIVPPEPLADYLFACFKIIATLGQFGNDCRNLMRTEIGELREPFAIGQVGSSTMAHKRNPITFEGLVGAWVDSQAEFLKVMLTLNSDHQRDLTASSVMRDFPTLVVLLVRQLEALLRPDKSDRLFIDRIIVDTDACARNLQMSSRLVLAEPLYLAIQEHGYPGDAHEIVNHRLVPLAANSTRHLVDILSDLAQAGEPEIVSALGVLPDDVREQLRHPEQYIGLAPLIARETAERARKVAGSL